MKKGVNWFSGQEILVEDLGHLNDGYQEGARGNVFDFWGPGIVKDPNGLSNMAVSVDALTASLINVGQGVAYVGGYRIAIERDAVYSAANPTQTTNGICTPQSTGNKAIPLASYAPGQSNFVWAQYLEVARTNPVEVSAYDGSKHYPFADHGYSILVNTTNPPGSTAGMTHAVYLATVFGQGNGNPLQAAPVGLCQSRAAYATVWPKDSVGTVNLQDKSVTPQKVDPAGSYTMNGLCVHAVAADTVAATTVTADGLCARNMVGSVDIAVPVVPLRPTSAASRRFAQRTGFGIASSETLFSVQYDGNGNLSSVVLSGDNVGLITPTYDGSCNIITVSESIDGSVASHQVTYGVVGGDTVVTSVQEAS